MKSIKYTFRASDLTKSGSLKTRDLQLVSYFLLHHSYILLPSDTGYSIAALANSRAVYDRVNKLLRRDSEPISLAFNNFRRVEEYIEMDMVAAHLLEKFTPGPLTLVCKANSQLEDDVSRKTLGSDKKTIGVRLPDSMIEREVSACTIYPITTAAVREPVSKQIVTDFDQAIEIITNNTKDMDNVGVIAIEGDSFYSKHSTVVEVSKGTERISLIREGDIPFDDIKNSVETIPYSQWAVDDWL